MKKEKNFAEEKKFIFQEVITKNGNNFENFFEVQLFEAVYNKFKSEFDKREEMYNGEQGNYVKKKIPIKLIKIISSQKQIILLIKILKKRKSVANLYNEFYLQIYSFGK